MPMPVPVLPITLPNKFTYDVVFTPDLPVIHTLVTHDPDAVIQWIHDVVSTHGPALLCGLDLEWRPNYARTHQNPAATLQLCVGHFCLIFQLIHAPYFPFQLVQFLSNPNNTFLGIGIRADLEKIQRDYWFGWSVNSLDLRELAAEVYARKELRNAGLKSLAKVVLGKEVEKVKSVTMSEWDNHWLTPVQVRYACIDAFVSFEIGRVLLGLVPVDMAPLVYVPVMFVG